MSTKWTRKDYELVSNIIRGYIAAADSMDYETGGAAVEMVMDCMADEFAYEFGRDNENFNKARFLEACNV